MNSYRNIPTHIISGFLGSGKTSFIQKLIKHKPQNERWAVIVNEFGKVGLDAALLACDGQNSVQVKELAGGCVCCVLGPSFTTQLNEVIRRTSPHRIFIEPTGLGHPNGLVNKLTHPPYDKVLDLQPVVTLLDPQMLLSQKITDHPTFIDQLSIADVIAISKTDMLDKDICRQGYDFAQNIAATSKQVASTIELISQLGWEEHTGDTKLAIGSKDKNQPTIKTPTLSLFSTPKGKPFRFEHSHQGTFSCGWIYSDKDVFDIKKLETFCQTNTSFLRLKAVCQTSEGWVSINQVGTNATVQPTSNRKDSRIEVISASVYDWQALENQLAQLLKP